MPAKKKKTKSESTVSEEALNVESLNTANVEQDPFINNYLLSWEAPEFVYHPKSALWHIAAFAAVAVLIIVSLLMKQWLAIAVFVILGFLVFRYAEVQPKNIEISLTNVGIKVGDIFYPYNKLKSFWLVYEPPIKTLNLETTKRFSPIITIQLEDQDPFLVKNILKEHLLEESERTEDLIDKISRFLRF